MWETWFGPEMVISEHNPTLESLERDLDILGVVGVEDKVEMYRTE